MSIPPHFEELTAIVRNALEEFRSPTELDLHGVAQDLLSFDRWETLVRPRAGCHASRSGRLSISKSVAPHIFPCITASLFMVRVHWMTDQQQTDFPGQIASVPLGRTRRSIEYWLGNIPDRLIALRSRSLDFLQLRDPFPLGPAPTSQQLIEYALHLDTNSEQYRLLSHIYFCAAAVRGMMESGPLQFFVSVMEHFVCLMINNIIGDTFLPHHSTVVLFLILHGSY